jgi:hypothetical protein
MRTKKNGASARAVAPGSTRSGGRKRPRFFYDRRTVAAREWQGLFNEYYAAAGQRHPQLCATAASLAVERSRLDHALARGERVSVDHLVRLSGTLARVLGKLGIVQPAKPRSRWDEVLDALKAPEAHA